MLRGNAATPPGTTTPRPKRLPHKLADQAHHPLLVQREPGGGDRQPGRVGQPHRDVEVVGDPLEFGVHDANDGGRDGDLAAGDRLDRVAVGEGVGDGGDAFGPLGQQRAVGDRPCPRTAR